MVRKLIPLLLALTGLAIGIAGGFFLRPAEEHVAESGETVDVAAEIDPESLPEYVKMNNQFIVPVLEDGRVAAMVIMSLSVEVTAGSTEEVFSKEPKLRDAFLQVLFDHANAGGFQGSFTDGSNLVFLRTALREAAVSTLGDIATDVLIGDIARQDN